MLRCARLGLLILVSLAAGYVMGRRFDGAKPRPISVPAPPDQMIRPDSIAVAPEPKGTAPAAAPEPISVLAALRDKHPDSVRISVVTRRDKIDESFSTLLDLSSEQTEALNGILGRARTRLNALAAASATLAVAENGTISVNVAPFEGGGEIYDELMDKFAGVLGAERTDSFKRLFGEEFAELFHHFGAEQRSLTIAETLPGYVDWNDGMYYIKDERRTEHERLETIAFRFRADRMEYLPPHLHWLEPLITGRLPPLINRQHRDSAFIKVTQ